MLFYDCFIITIDVLLTSSPHLHAALCISSFVMLLRSWDCQDQLSSPPANFGVGERWGSIHREPSQFWPKEYHQSLVMPIKYRFVSLLYSPFLFFFLFLFLVRWCPLWKSSTVCIQNLNAFCQLAVPAVTVEIHLSADVPSVWHRVASPSILKGLSWPAGTEGR